ncbi:hypothetical protein DSO57_1027804 [Entomophthora muscae]|uniref:Uncharacterized protein n=1 Tax=Entomophthora muscae TaxID=34485 RepID=A0ACC2SQM7_9FUNG|nr:hypothetical protein DSO57_1027804 [Entomophthora muscae]
MTTHSSWCLAMTQDTLWGLVDRNPTLVLLTGDIQVIFQGGDALFMGGMLSLDLGNHFLVVEQLWLLLIDVSLANVLYLILCKSTTDYNRIEL